MENKITAFYVENFKAIEKGTWFDVNHLTIITGANNSGKSTLFKAMSVLTNGFTKGDFPLIDIQKDLPGNGYFSDLITRDSQKDYFKIGFRYESERLKNIVEIVYQFVQGETEQFAEFGSMTVSVNNEDVINFYSSSKHSEPVPSFDAYGRSCDFKSVLEDSNPGEIIFSINLSSLKILYGAELTEGHSALFDRMESEFNGRWIGEAFIEEIFNFTSKKYFARLSGHLYADMMDDYYCNFYNYENKYPIFHDSDGVEVKIKYKNDIQTYGYSEFLKDFIKPLFDEISLSLHFFYNKQLFHIKLTDRFYERVILANEINFRLPIINTKEVNQWKESTDPNSFEFFLQSQTTKIALALIDSLRLLGFSGHIITKEIDNHAYQVFYESPDGKEYNIADLGKGQAQIIQLLLALSSRIIEEDSTGISPRNKSIFSSQTIIHLEEPEVFLHPKWQSKLADIFCLIAKTNFKLLIETHSEYLIRKIQYIIAKGEFDPKNVSIYYFEDTEERKEHPEIPFYRNISLDKHGRMSQDFGPGFFDEADNIAIQLFNINQQNQN